MSGIISEAVYLKKPVCSYPIKNQFEQFVNAAYISKLGFGKHLSELNADGIKAFLYDMKKFTENISKYSQQGNSETFSKIDIAIDKLEKNTLKK